MIQTSVAPLSTLSQANEEQYKTTANLDVRQAFNTLPKENMGDVFLKLSDYYKESGFLDIPGNSLEVGGGNGLLWKIAGKNFCKEMKEKGHIFVTDSSQGMVDACKNVGLLNNSEITLEVADVTNLKYGDESFARIIGNFMLYECKTAMSVEKGISEIVRVLQADGRAIFVTMDEKAHMIQLYATLQEAKDRLGKKGIIIKTEFPQYAPAIMPFCAGNAINFLNKAFEKVTISKIDNAILVSEKLPEPNDTVSGPDFVVKYLQSLAFVQAAMKAQELSEIFFKTVHDIVADEIKNQGVFRITRCDMIYDCANPKKNVAKTLENIARKA